MSERFVWLVLVIVLLTSVCFLAFDNNLKDGTIKDKQQFQERLVEAAVYCQLQMRKLIEKLPNREKEK